MPLFWQRSAFGVLFLLVLLGNVTQSADAQLAAASDSDTRVTAYSITPPNGNNEIFTIQSDGTGLQQLTNHAGRDAAPAWSPDATRIAFYAHWPDETTWSIYVMDADGGNLEQLTTLQGVYDNGPTWSPDGGRIAFAREYLVPEYRAEIWVMNADGSDQHQIAATLGGGPEWSPDGSEIVFHSDRDGNLEIYAMAADGSNLRRLTDTPTDDYWPDWSPDGRQIVFRSNRDGNGEIYTMNADGTNPVRLTDHPAEDSRPDWSPGGTEIAWTTDRDGHYEIYLMNSDGTNQRRLTNTSIHAIQPDWRPDSSATTGVDRIRIAVYDVSGRLITELADGVFGAGTHSVYWDGRDGGGPAIPPGTYLARLESEGQVETKKIAVIR